MVETKTPSSNTVTGPDPWDRDEKTMNPARISKSPKDVKANL
jgi:hypothetical protein